MTRQEKRDELERTLGHYVRRKVPFGPDVYLIAQNQSNPNITAALNAVLAWAKTAYVALRTALNAVDAAPDEATWDAVTIDFAALDASHPGTTLQSLVQL